MEKQRIRKILVPLDGSKNSQRGLESAIHLAKEHEASLTAIHVIHKIHGAKGRKVLELEEEVPPQFVLLAKKLASKNGIPFYTRILTGDPGHEIVNYANIHSIDLIVIGARGLSSFKKIFLGSVSSYVMHTTKTAVLVIK